jgi:hypothetical protein
MTINQQLKQYLPKSGGLVIKSNSVLPQLHQRCIEKLL